VLRELLPALGLPQNSRFLFYGLIMVLMMRWRPAGMLPIPAVAQRMRAQKVKRRVTWFKKGQEK
jgi:branched-chain amino acid transport system permease protein